MVHLYLVMLLSNHVMQSHWLHLEEREGILLQPGDLEIGRDGHMARRPRGS